MKRGKVRWERIDEKRKLEMREKAGDERMLERKTRGSKKWREKMDERKKWKKREMNREKVEGV